MANERDSHIVIKKPDPEDSDSHLYEVECPGRPACDGFIECRERHTAEGFDADDGEFGDPNDCPPDVPWEGMDEFEFHGVVHTFWSTHWWTVPYDGCVVRDHPYFPECAEELLCELPPGRYPVRGHWGDEEMELTLIESGATR